MANILVVEDEDQLREIMVEHLEDEGHEIAQAINGREALDIYPSFKPDLVISDINMPVMGGYDFLKALQTQHPEVEDIPFFFISALSDSKDQLKGLNSGIDEYLCKPVDFTLLSARIDLSLKRQERVQAKIRSAVEESKAASEKAGKPANATATTRPNAADSSNSVRQPASAPTGLLASKRPKLSSRQKETILSANIVENLHSAALINRLGRKTNISRIFFKKEYVEILYSAMISSEFESDFFQDANRRFSYAAEVFIENKNYLNERAIIFPIFFQCIHNNTIRSQYIEAINSIEEKQSIAIVCEIINIPNNMMSYIGILKEISLRKHVQIIEIKSFDQIKDIDLKALRVGAITMEYNHAINLPEKELSTIKEALSKLDINFYIKEIPEGKIAKAQSLQPDLLSAAA